MGFRNHFIADDIKHRSACKGKGKRQDRRRDGNSKKSDQRTDHFHKSRHHGKDKRPPRAHARSKHRTDAIEEFERTLVTPDSRFDKWLRGDDSALAADELAGYELFKTYDCATCHVGPNLGGQSYELMGLRRHYFADRGTELTNEDNGRYKETQHERDRHRFKVPGLRNIELTWPYYHDGTRLTLEDAVRDMGYYQSGVELTDDEVNQMTSFLKTLTGEYNGIPLANSNTRP